MMDTAVSNGPVQTCMDNRHEMRVSHDENRAEPKDLCSLGVVDLDLSLLPDAFGLRAFDSQKPLTWMLPGSSPCELRLSLLSIDDDRRLSSGPCRNDQGRWKNSVG